MTKRLIDTPLPPGWNAQREKVFLDRYALKDAEGKPLEKHPEEMWRRVADFMGDNTAERKSFKHILSDFRFVPGGRILAGAGSDHEVTFYNCYVIPVETEARRENRYTGTSDRADEGSDSREAIFDTIGRMVNLMSRGGGVGINWSVLRPSGGYLKSVNGTSSGPCGWMHVASEAVGEVEQGGSRRGAAMFMLSDWHPDVLSFINMKRDLKRTTNANVSVAVSDAFMDAVENDEPWPLLFPRTDHPDYNQDWTGDLDAWITKYGREAVETYRVVQARDVWRSLAEAAWDNGEPGVIFLDRCNKLTTAVGVETLICVNPCGEQPLGPYSVCCLGAMNLNAYTHLGSDPSIGALNFDMAAFKKDVHAAIRFLDASIDKQDYSWMPETDRIQRELIRRVGLSTMGDADALIRMKIRYGSPEAVRFIDAVYEAMKIAALEASVDLAIEKGPAGAWSPEMIERPYFQGIPDDLRAKIAEHGLRNLLVLTQAPTGTTSILAGVNSGIEPYFAFEYRRKDRTGEHIVRAPVVEEYRRDNGDGELPEYFVTANEVTVEEHIAMQAAAQQHIDSSVSKTLNAPNSHSIEDTERAYTLAYQSGLKSIAYFRDGCGRDQVLNRVDDAPAVKPAKTYQRPKELQGRTIRQATDVGTAYITINDGKDGWPVEVFINIGRAGSDLNVLAEAVGRMISLALRRGIKPDEIAGRLHGVGGYSRLQPSLPHALALSLTEQQLVDEAQAPQELKPIGELCPNCAEFSLIREEGCTKCHFCGYSAC